MFPIRTARCSEREIIEAAKTKGTGRADDKNTNPETKKIEAKTTTSVKVG